MELDAVNAGLHCGLTLPLPSGESRGSFKTTATYATEYRHYW
jgi:hypothetical protein